MTADPRRVPNAHVIDRASLEEMHELSQHGAKVMHHKAAGFARIHRHALCDQRFAHRSSARSSMRDTTRERPVTGVTASGRVTWIRVIRGDIENASHRMQTELEMFRRIADAEISIDQVTINQAGVAFVVDGDRGNEVRALLGDLNLAVRVREGCAKISVVGTGMRYRPASCIGVCSR